MSNPGQELSSMDFSSIIGGSLNAVVVAQAQSAKTSVDFIRSVGFTQRKDGAIGDPIFVSFKYPKQTKAATETEAAVFQDMEIKVPILTMMPIPFIRIANAEIDLNVKINSVSETSTSSSENKSLDVGADASFGFGGFKASVNVKASVSNQKQSSSSEKTQKDFSLHINVKATQDEMPAGVSRILDILEDSITSKAFTESKAA